MGFSESELRGKEWGGEQFYGEVLLSCSGNLT